MLFSPALAYPFDGHKTAADVKESACLSGVNQTFIELRSQEGMPSACGASLVYAGYPFDPYA